MHSASGAACSSVQHITSLEMLVLEQFACQFRSKTGLRTVISRARVQAWRKKVTRLAIGLGVRACRMGLGFKLWGWVLGFRVSVKGCDEKPCGAGSRAVRVAGQGFERAGSAVCWIGHRR